MATSTTSALDPTVPVACLLQHMAIGWNLDARNSPQSSRDSAHVSIIDPFQPLDTSGSSNVPEPHVMIPVELYRPIAEFIASPRKMSFDVGGLCQAALCNMSLASRVLREEAQRALFRCPQVRLNSGFRTVRRFRKLAESIINSPDRLALFVNGIMLNDWSFATFDDETLPPYTDQRALVNAFRLMVNLKHFVYVDISIILSLDFFRGCPFQLDTLIWKSTRYMRPIPCHILPTQQSLKHLTVLSLTSHHSDSAGVDPPYLPNLVSLEGNTETLTKLCPFIGRRERGGAARSLKCLTWTHNGRKPPCDLVASMSHFLTELEGLSLRGKGPTPNLSVIVQNMPNLVILEMGRLKSKQQIALLGQLPMLRRFIFTSPATQISELCLQMAQMFLESCPQLECVDLSYFGEKYQRFESHMMPLFASWGTSGGASSTSGSTAPNSDSELKPPMLNATEVRTVWKLELLRRFCDLD